MKLNTTSSRKLAWHWAKVFLRIINKFCNGASFKYFVVPFFIYECNFRRWSNERLIFSASIWNIFSIIDFCSQITHNDYEHMEINIYIRRKYIVIQNCRRLLRKSNLEKMIQVCCLYTRETNNKTNLTYNNIVRTSKSWP